MYEQRLHKLKKYGLPQKLVEDFDRWLAMKDPIQSQKISPVDFSSEMEYELKDSFKVFHYASLEFILDRYFEVICPSCLKRIVLSRHLTELNQVFSCLSCSKEFTTDHVRSSSKVWFSHTPSEAEELLIDTIIAIQFEDGTEWENI
ncbi:hypothetical protein ACQCN2_15480 [Brevibacillus ginsengisoli]|uniref:hypothetical protein n=1 Tax=Brevibacillus ginsengisoli TaxID=363854 RepID=UPI003CF9BBF6